MFKNYKEIRVIIYAIGIVAQIASFFVSIRSPEFGQAFVNTADLLTVVALGTALSNLSDNRDTSEKVYDIADEDPDDHNF